MNENLVISSEVALDLSTTVEVTENCHFERSGDSREVSEKLKIFVTHNAGSSNFKVENEIFLPVFSDPDALRKSGCECVADKTQSYCELTTQYWAWKNVDADYYGFCHYRRYFAFSDSRLPKPDSFSVVRLPKLTQESARQIGLLDCGAIRRAVEKFDVVVPIPTDFNANGIKSVYEQYKIAEFLHIEDLDLALKIISEETPEYCAAAKRCMNGRFGYFCNMFVMKKELFFRYSEWLFKILEKFCERKQMENYSREAFRTPGHLGERLFSVFLERLKEEGNIKIGERRIVLFDDSQDDGEFLPAFENNNIPIVFSCNEKFAKFVGVALRSIAENASGENNYDVIVLHSGIGEQAKSLLKKTLNGRKNFSLRFFNPRHFFDGRELAITNTISVETYYRLIIPEFFARYDKMLYLDGDIIATSDVAELFAIDIGDNYFAAAIDVDMAGRLNRKNDNPTQYYKALGFNDIQNYVNAGVIAVNAKKMREDFSAEFLLNFASSRRLRWQDQDALNIVCDGKIARLPLEWNVFADPLNESGDKAALFAPKKILEAWETAVKSPKIIHFAGIAKPWNCPQMKFADLFLECARKTSFYEQIIGEMANFFVDRKSAAFERISGIAFLRKCKNFLKRKLPPSSFLGRTARKIWRKVRKK